MIEHNKNQDQKAPAWLAQSAERETLNLKVAGSTPASGLSFCKSFFWSFYLFFLLVGRRRGGVGWKFGNARVGFDKGFFLYWAGGERLQNTTDNHAA